MRRTLPIVMSLALVLALSAEGVIAADKATAEASVAPAPSSFALPDRIRGVEHGRFRTRLGPVRWARLSGTRATLPMEIEQLMPVPGGYAVLGGEDRQRRSRAVPEYLWFSPDLIRWSRRDLPVEADEASLTRVGDRYWLVTGSSEWPCCAVEDQRLWVSHDAATWTELELDPRTRPHPTDLDWRLQIDPPLGDSDRVLVPYRWWLDSTGPLLGMTAGPCVVLDRSDDGVFGVRVVMGPPLATVRFDEVDDGLEVIEMLSGRSLATVRGIDRAFVERWAATGAATEERLATIVDGRIVSDVHSPVHRADGTAPAGTALTAAGGRFSLVERSDDGRVQVRRSTDGASWSEPEPVSVDGAAPVTASSLYLDGDVARLDERGRRGGSWTSADAASWTWEPAERRRRDGRSGRTRVRFRLGDGTGWFTKKPPLRRFAYQPDRRPKARIPVSLAPIGIDRQVTVIQLDEDLIVARAGNVREQQLWLIEFRRLGRS